MATLEEVLAALNAAGMDAREVLSKLPEIATTNGDVPFTFSDGTQIALPGLPKLKAEVDGFINDAEATIKEWWNRTLYVHPDGDDNAPGTEDAPLTLEGALAAIPPGGKGVIKLLGGSYVLNNDIILSNNSIILHTLDTAEITTTTFDSSGYDRPRRVILENSQILVYGYEKLKISTPSSDNPYVEPLFMSIETGHVGIYKADIEVSTFPLAGVYLGVGTLSHITACLSHCKSSTKWKLCF